MSCLAIRIGTAVDTLLEQFSRREHGGCGETTAPPGAPVAREEVCSSARNEHRAIDQQRRRMSVPWCDERARRREPPTLGSEKLRRRFRLSSTPAAAARDEDRAVVTQCRRGSESR